MYILTPTIDATAPIAHAISNTMPKDSVLVSIKLIRSRFSPFAKKWNDNSLCYDHSNS